LAPGAWLDKSGYDEGYRFLGRFLRHLQGPGAAPRRWILKSPEHVFSFDALARVFPDAMLALVHRDPGHVLTSAARLTELLRAPFTTAGDRPEGRGLLARRDGAWSRSRMIRPFRCAPGLCTCATTRSSPIRLERSRGSTTRSGLSSRATPGRRWRRESPRLQNGGYGANRYRPEEFGIDPERERERARAYAERFGVATT
jgi:hypothetical protein